MSKVKRIMEDLYVANDCDLDELFLSQELRNNDVIIEDYDDYSDVQQYSDAASVLLDEESYW